MTARVLWFGLLFLAALTCTVVYDLLIGSYERAARDAFSESLGSDDERRFEWACGPECSEWLSRMSPISGIGCTHRIGPAGRCCAVVFGGRYRSEVHVHRLQGGRYRIAPRIPQCLHPESDPPGDPWWPRWVQCGEEWGPSSGSIPDGA
jgi:hypothetical protein